MFFCTFLAPFWMEYPDNSKIIWNHHILNISAQQLMFCFLNPVTAKQLVLERPSRWCVRISGEIEMPGLWDHCFCGGEGVWPCWLLADPAASVSTHLSAAALTQYPDVWEREKQGEREGVFLLPKWGSQTWISDDVKGVNLCVWCFSIRCHLSSLSTVTAVILNHRHVTHASTVLLLRMTNQRKWSISD